MIHQYQNNGYRIVLDVYSGAVHVVDELCYDLIAWLTQQKESYTAQELGEDELGQSAVQALSGKYKEEEIREGLADIQELTEAGQLFT